ncbi:MAG: hypothetical protein DRI69_06355 [Bacteroidetes bacterium]|nr:MAG: hypothetical protein DRI69_06355 [Bacteroidota bacterium]
MVESFSPIFSAAQFEDMSKSHLIIASTLAILLVFCADAGAQIDGPGAQRDYDRIQELKRGSVLQQDTVVLRDTILLYDPETYVETMQIVMSRYSVFDYCRDILGISNPNDLLDGQEMSIPNPETYEPMKVRWNASEGKIDTIQ